MAMARRGLALLVLVVLVTLVGVLALPRAARADQPGGHSVPVAVLALDSEDAEDNADGLTQALRSRVRKAPGWSLINTEQSLGMLTAALKCPARPTPECQQRIADQIKAERYIYGYVQKGPQQGQVTAEIHLFQKGKADTVVRESYADNLKDGNEDSLLKIAGRVVERLGGVAVGIVVVKAPDQTGEIVVDGEKHVPLKDGTAKIELAGGGHAIELAPTSGPVTKRNVLVSPGRETVVEFTSNAHPVVEGPEKPFPTRKVVGGAIGVTGIALVVVSVVSLAAWSSAISDGEDAANGALSRNGRPVGDTTECREYDSTCRKFDDSAKKNSTIAWITGAAGGVALIVGAYLFFSDGPKESAPAASAKAPPKPSMRILPTAGRENGFAVIGSF